MHVCVSVCQLLLSPGAGPAGACSYHLKFQSNSHSVAVPGCDNTQTSQLLLCLCAGSSSALQSDGPFFFLQYLNLTTLNAYSCSKQIRHTKTNVLNICIDMHGPLPEQELFWTKYPRTHCVSVR